MDSTTGDVTRLLREWSEGDPEALDKLLPIILDQVHGLCQRILAGESRDTLQPTALINEVYLRLVDRKTYDWGNRREFFGTLATIMRRVLVDRARRRGAAKRGGGAGSDTLDENIFLSPPRDPVILRLNDALDALEQENKEYYRIVMLNYFVGLKQGQIAEEIGLSINTVGRRLKAARTWLLYEMQQADEAEEDESESA